MANSTIIENCQQVDLKNLLKKYIQHIVSFEGIDYIDRCGTDPVLYDVVFTPEEITVLKTISEED